MTAIRTTLGLLLAVLVAGAFAAAGSASPRSGNLHVTKECSQYFGEAGQYCTITGSNLPAISSGMRVVYLSAAGADSLDTDLVLDGPGNNDASGHVTLDFHTLSGIVTFSGGTGRFQGFNASVDVTYDAQTGLWRWDGTYSFAPPGQG